MDEKELQQAIAQSGDPELLKLYLTYQIEQMKRARETDSLIRDPKPVLRKPLDKASAEVIVRHQGRDEPNITDVRKCPDCGLEKNIALDFGWRKVRDHWYPQSPCRDCRRKTLAAAKVSRRAK